MWGCWDTGPGCPEELLAAPGAAPSLECSRPLWMGLGDPWSSGRCPCPQKWIVTRWFLGPFQPKAFCNSIILNRGKNEPKRQLSAVWFMSSPVKGISHGHSEVTSSHTDVSGARRQKCDGIFATAHGGYFPLCFFRGSVLSYLWSWWQALTFLGVRNLRQKKGKHLES